MRLTFDQRLALAGIPPQPTRVVIHLRNAEVAGVLADFEALAESSLGSLWRAIRDASGGKAIHGALREFSEDAFAELMRHVRAADPDLPAVADLSLYRTIEVPHGLPVEPLLLLLDGLAPDVRYYVASLSALPPAGDQPPPEPLRSTQRYQNPAPIGIDAEYAWDVEGGDGAFKQIHLGPDDGRVHVIDIEMGWVRDHQDLPTGSLAIPLLSGVNWDFRGHGTAVLGILAAQDNASQALGTVAQARVKVISEWRTGPPIVRGLHEAICALLPGGAHPAPKGSIILLESTVQHSVAGFGEVDLPADFEELNHAAITSATLLGMVVIEPAGNGGIVLNGVLPAWSGGLGAGAGTWPDSGAIVVSGAQPGAAPQMVGLKNRGSRVHCFAWGEQVVTLGSGDLDNTRIGQRTDFNGTSSAAAIVAAAAASAQGMIIADTLAPALPATLRTILSDPLTGTPSNTPGTDLIGVMPNLRIIAEQRIMVASNVIIRSIIGDQGIVRAHAQFESPDIFVGHLPPDPLEDGRLIKPWDPPRPTRVWVRPRNVGSRDSGKVRITVYRTPLTSIPMRREWRLVGNTYLSNLPPDGVPRVAPGIEILGLPPSEQYFQGLVAVAHSIPDRAPDLRDLDDLEALRYQVRFCNNLAFRMVCDARFPEHNEGPRFVPFRICGPVCEDAKMDLILKVEGRLEARKGIFLRLPSLLANALTAGGWPLDNSSDGAGFRIAEATMSHVGLIADQVLLAQLAMHECAWVLRPRSSVASVPVEIRLQTRYRGIVIGELIWRLA